ncbi:MAG: acyltransferase family protein [Arenicella sp.]
MLSFLNRLSYSVVVNAISVAALFIIFYFLVGYFTANALSKVSITGVFPESGLVKVSIGKHTHDYSEALFFDAKIIGSKKEQSISIPLNNRVVHKLKFDFRTIQQSVELRQITLNSYFQSKPTTIHLTHQTHPVAKQTGVILTSSDSSYEVTSLTINKHFFVHILVPLCLAFACWLLCQSFDWRRFPAIEDVVNNQQGRNANNLQALDGLRGIAAFTVLLEHTMYQFIGLGRAGVWLFFVLSGFLLTRSFVLNPEKMLTIAGLKTYFVKRIKRILPMFYVMVTVVFLLLGKVDTAMRHYLLVQGDGHYWTILHELYFYMFLPIIACACYFLFKQRYLFSMLFLTALAVAWYYLGSSNLISIYGLGRQHVPYFYVFLLGMTAGYFYYGMYRQSEVLQQFCQKWGQVLGIIALGLMFVFFFYSSKLEMVDEVFSVFEFPFASAMIVSMLVLASAVLSHSSIYNRVLSLSLFRLIGVIGYSFYLVHPYAIAIFKAIFEFIFLAPPSSVIPGFFIMLGSFLITMPIAMFTYSYIERPFLRRQAS